MEENKCENCGADFVDGKCPNCSVDGKHVDKCATCEGDDCKGCEVKETPAEEKSAE